MIGDFIYILCESSTVSNVEELHSFAYSEDWFSREKYFSHRHKKISVILRADTSCTTLLSSIEAWIDIWSTRKDECITELDISTDIATENRDHDRESSGRFYRSDIVKREIIEYPSRMIALLSEDTDFFHHKKFIYSFVGVFGIFAIFISDIYQYTKGAIPVDFLSIIWRY